MCVVSHIHYEHKLTGVSPLIRMLSRIQQIHSSYVVHHFLKGNSPRSFQQFVLLFAPLEVCVGDFFKV